MGKSPGFWFFTGDWLKDAELRFCSIFARGLLVDLLCLMFEAKDRGFLSKPDGTPRSDVEIVSAINGGTVEEKLQALAELEASGALSRDKNGVLYSRRLSRLNELSEKRKQSGSKGGSKTQAKGEAKPKQTINQSDKQNRGVTVTDSDTDSDSVIINKQTQARELSPHWSDEGFREIWFSWLSHVASKHGPASEATEQVWLFKLADFGTSEATDIVRFSIEKQAKNLIANGDHKQEPRKAGGFHQETGAEKFEKLMKGMAS